MGFLRGDSFILSWVLSLFSGTQFPIEITASIWDSLFLYGERHIMRAALAICKCVETDLLVEMKVTGDPDDVQWFKSFSKEKLAKHLEDKENFITT